VLIILEGPDWSGKTTLVEKLTKQLHDCTVIQLQRGPLKPESDPVFEYTHQIDGYTPGRAEHVIADRWHLGELVYGPLKREGSRLTPAQRWYIDAFIAARGGLIVYVDESLDVLQLRALMRSDDYVDASELRLIKLGYDVALTHSYAPLLRITPSVQLNATDAILRAALVSDQYAQPLAAFPTYVGPMRPGILLLGERRGPRNLNGHRSAFVPYPGTSGAYLVEALQLEERRYALANALEEDLELLCQVTQPMSVVALGHAANDAATKAGVPHGAVPHPQYWRRFMHHSPQAYVSIINHAAATKENMISWRPSSR
jgi:hypothetical protein